MANEKAAIAGVSVAIEVEWSKVEDALCAAWEGGSNYWLECYDFRPPSSPEDAARVEYRYQNALYAGGALLCRAEDEETELVLTREKLEEGVRTLAKLHPRHFLDLWQESGDALTGDALVQCAFFGKLVYG
jgi:hypothetical protein